MNKKEGTMWIDLIFENIPMLCFDYEIIGHNEEFCVLESLRNPDPHIKHPFGPWFRST